MVDLQKGTGTKKGSSAIEIQEGKKSSRKIGKKTIRAKVDQLSAKEDHFGRLNADNISINPYVNRELRAGKIVNSDYDFIEKFRIAVSSFINQNKDTINIPITNIPRILRTRFIRQRYRSAIDSIQDDFGFNQYRTFENKNYFRNDENFAFSSNLLDNKIVLAKVRNKYNKKIGNGQYRDGTRPASPTGLEKFTSAIGAAFKVSELPLNLEDEFTRRALDTREQLAAVGDLDAKIALDASEQSHPLVLCVPAVQAEKYRGKKISGEIYAFLERAYAPRVDGEPLTVSYLAEHDPVALKAFHNRRRTVPAPPVMSPLTIEGRGSKQDAIIRKFNVDLKSDEGIADAKKLASAIINCVYRNFEI